MQPSTRVTNHTGNAEVPRSYIPDNSSRADRSVSTGKLIHLIYASRVVNPLTPDDVISILDASRRNNRTLGITGMLLHCRGSLFQVLEGEEAAVDEMFSHIERDPRHDGVAIIIREALASRAFRDWSMGFAEVTDDQLVSTLGLNDFFGRQSSLLSIGKGRARKLLQAFSEGIWHLSEKETSHVR